MKKRSTSNSTPPPNSRPGAEEILYGLHAVRHALEHRPERVLNVWIQEGKKTGPAFNRILDLSRRHAVRLEFVPKADLDGYTGSAAHQGVVLRRQTGAESPADLDAVLAGSKLHTSLFLVLDGVQDPHNLGACLRTANAAGADAIIVPRDQAAAVTPVVRKVASGAAESTPVITVTNLSRALRDLQEAGVWVVGTDDEAEQSLYDLDLTPPVAMVLGGEGRGLRQNTRKHCDYLASLPMNGIVESLNVSVAAGICLYEVLRQRKYRH